MKFTIKKLLIKHLSSWIPVRRWRKTVRRVLADPLNNSPIGRYISRNLDENGATAYLNRKVLISSQKKFIYLRLYKCACSKITGALIEDLTSRELSHRQDIHSVKWYGQVEKTVQIDENIEAVLADPTYFKFTFVRNPYERILSAWKNKIDNPEKYPDGREGDRQRSKINKKGERVSFEEFVNLLYEQRDRACSFDKHWAPQHYLLLLPFIEYDFIGRIETFSRDFENVLRKINAKPHLIEKISTRINPSPKTELGDFYTDDLKNKVYEIYKKDFELLGYEKKLPGNSMRVSLAAHNYYDILKCF